MQAAEFDQRLEDTGGLAPEESWKFLRPIDGNFSRPWLLGKLCRLQSTVSSRGAQVSTIVEFTMLMLLGVKTWSHGLKVDFSHLQPRT